MARSNGDDLQRIVATALAKAGAGAGDSILVGTSGGVDSVVLARILHDLKKKKIFGRLAVAHLDHGLRGKQSASDAAFVAAFAKKLGVECFCESVNVGAISAKEKLGLEETGRNARYKFFRRIAAREHFRWVATAHNADDRVETLLMNIVRGTGLRGLGGIPAVRALSNEIAIVRPLLEASREQIEAFARAKKLRWREDASNRSAAFTRNRLRKDVIPALRKSMPDRNIYDGVSRLASHVEEVETFLDAEAETLLRVAVVRRSPSFFVRQSKLEFKAEVLAKAPKVVVRQLLLRRIESLAERTPAISSQSWNRIFELIASGSSKRVQISNALSVSRRNNIVSLESSVALEEINELLEVNTPVATRVGDISLSRTTRKPKLLDANLCILGATVFESHGLLLRNWKPADRIRPFGMKGSRLVSDLLSEAGVSTESAKRRFPLVVLADAPKTVVWVPGIRAAELCRLEKPSETALLLKRTP